MTDPKDKTSNGSATIEGGIRAGTPRVAYWEVGMECSVQELYRRAKRVAKTHNGKHYTRREQIDSMVQLQILIQEIERQDRARTALEPEVLELPLSVPLPSSPAIR